MKGYILLADGTRLEGTLLGAPRTAMGYLVANTAVVGFQEMVTDPAYKGAILAFTYPEIGNVGVTAAFSESSAVQVAGLAVKVLSEYRSHYLSEGDFGQMLAEAKVPCLVGVDTRGLAVHLRQAGEMAAAIAPADADEQALRESLAGLSRPPFEPSAKPPPPQAGAGPTVAVLDLGIRRSQLAQLALCCRPVVFPHDASEETVLACRPAGVFISDGPGGVLPPAEVARTVAALLGKAPLLGCGLGHVALGLAAGCRATFLKRGHHGANYPVRNLVDGTVEVTEQRHTVMLDRDSVQASRAVSLLAENINDGSVEGIRSPDARSAGLQFTLAAHAPGTVNVHIRRFVDALAKGAP